MDKNFLAIIAAIAITLVSVIGDYFLKIASAEEQPLTTKWFILGFIFISSTAFGWVFIMKHITLATIGVVYSVSTVLFLTIVSMVFFNEVPSQLELIGIIMALISLGLLFRFA
ncbi:MAG: hypothetical protein KME54_09185 [Tolypothrix brevis GSE-NOS-MK-07-07A]|jgi:small multidrug resistance pump|nr:hypothetical protein [Tolypothrix brevis GSE-NOS-MK-07-07A]